MKQNKIPQSGRSMVEMLGTLAIIGVLSVGAIAGYSYGMDKYRANETINDIMLKIVDIVSTANQNGVPDSTSWPAENPIGYPVSFLKDIPNDRYGIQLQNVPSRVCKMVGDALKNTAIVYVGGEEHNTNEQDPCDSSDKNTMEFYFDTGIVESDGCKNDSDCGDGRYCDKDTGICFWGGKPEETLSVCITTNECCVEGDSPYSKHGDDCTLSDGTIGQCNWGECLVKGCTYDKDKCTGFGVYCASPNISFAEAFPDGNTGWCREADFLKLEVGGETYYVSRLPLSWWDADAACKSLGKSLLSVDDLVSGWDGSSYGNHTPTALLEALASELGGYYYMWTKDLRNDDCAAFSISTDRYVDYYNRNHFGGSFALCQ